jgi:hypothetical protein
MADMKTIEIQHGSSKKTYAEVGERVKAFREKYGDSGQLITSIITNDSEKIVTQTQAIVNGVCLGTGLAEEIRGSTQVNKSSALENCETSSIGRAISFATGFMSDGSKIASTDEIQNAIVQQSQVDAHLKTMATLVVYVSTAFKEAIANDDEQGIEECRADMYGNQHLRAAVNKLLNAEEEEYMRDYMAKKSETRNVNAEEKAAKNQAYAKAFAEKQKQIKNTEV